MLCGQVFLPPTPSNAIISFYLLVATVGVLTSPVLAGVAVVVALVHVEVAVGSLEAGLAGAAVVVAQRGALGSVPTGLISTVVLLLAELASPAQGTGAGEGVQRGEVAAPPVTAGVGVAGVVHRGLAQGVGEAQGTGAGEGGDLALVLVHHTTPSILTDLLPSAAGVQVLAVLSNVFRGASRKQSDLVTRSDGKLYTVCQIF